MPPRRKVRTTAAAGNRTPAPATKPPPQNSTQGRTTALESTPLPDVEAEQSFAYGSSNTKPLPLQLVANKRMTIQQIAETLDAGISQAEKNFQAQREEAAEQYGDTIIAADPRTLRANRRSTTRESRGSSIDSIQTPVPKRTRRRQDEAVPFLQDIGEEMDSSQTVDRADTVSDFSTVPKSRPSWDRTSRTFPTPAPPFRQRSVGEQSTIPSLAEFDHTYNRERKFHILASANPPITLWTRFSSLMTGMRSYFLAMWHEMWQYILAYSPHHFLRRLDKIFAGFLSVCVLLLGGIILSRATCGWYGETGWSYTPSRPWHHRANNFCRFLSLERYGAYDDGSGSSIPVASASVSQVKQLAKEMREQKQLVMDLQLKQLLASNSIDKLDAQASNLMKQNADLYSSFRQAKADQMDGGGPGRSQPHGQYANPSALSKRINYASPGLGALIDPYMTSPTKSRHFPFYQRFLMDIIGLKKYQSPPPSEALRPYSDVGDCWCAADVAPLQKAATTTTTTGTTAGIKTPAVIDGEKGHYTQLAILLGTDIFPDEVGLEHIPLGSTPNPGSAPKDVEIWGDFSHLTRAEFTRLQSEVLPNPLRRVEWHPHQLGLLGMARYDAVANQRHGHILQSFRLDFNNQHDHGGDRLWTSKVIFRITSNWGVGGTCLYRVRIHGVPTTRHSEIVGDGLRS